jgi:hypothetical protein
MTMSHAEQAHFLFRHLLEDVRVATVKEEDRIGSPLTIREYRSEVVLCIQAYRDRGIAIDPVDITVEHDSVKGGVHRQRETIHG